VRGDDIHGVEIHTRDGTSGERDLVERCRRMDEDAWAELYRAHSQRVVRFLRYFLGPVRDVEDLTQQVFVRTVSSMDRFRGDSSLSTWLFGIARYVSKMHMRTEYRRDRCMRAFADWTEVTMGAGSDPSKGTFRREVMQVVSDVLEGMDIKRRDVWMMVEIEGMTCARVAGIMGIPPGTARSRLHYARGEILGAVCDAGVHRPAKGRGGCGIRTLDGKEGAGNGGVNDGFV